MKDTPLRALLRPRFSVSNLGQRLSGLRLPGAWLRLKWPSSLDVDEPASVRLTARDALIDCTIILLVVLAFCGGFLDLGSERPLPGNEAEVFLALDWTLSNAVRGAGQFPLWNPYLHTGLPYVADPMLHVYNPLVSLPVLVLGALDGFKIALFLSYLVAALGMWWLGRLWGLSRVARLWMAFMFPFSGQAVARFFQGQYLFVLGLAWIPWVLGFTIAARQTGRRAYAVAAAAALALLFFSGNIYYAYYMFAAFLWLTLVTVLDLRSDKPGLIFRPARLGVFLTIGLLALGLVAVQLLPLLEFLPRLSKATDMQMLGSHSLVQILRDYLSIDTVRPDAISLAREEFYAYIGPWPFLTLALLPFVGWRHGRRNLVFLLGLLVLVWFWVDIRHMPWAQFYARLPLASQFRYPTRMLIYGAFALVALGGIVLDTLWRRMHVHDRLEQVSVPGVLRWLAGRAGAGVLVAFVVWSVGDLYFTNGRYARTRDPYPPAQEIMRWLRASDVSTYYVSNPNGWHGAIVGNQLRYIDAWYHFADIRSRSVSSTRLVEARPRYAVIGNEATFPQAGATVLRKFATHTVYSLPHSLPFAFLAPHAVLADQQGGRELLREEVIEVNPVVRGPNRVEVTLDSAPDMTLVLLTTNYPGWRASVNGRALDLKNVGGYLAVELAPGQGPQRYVFEYVPLPFWAGLIISLATASLALWLLRPQLRAALCALTGATDAGETARSLPAGPDDVTLGAEAGIREPQAATPELARVDATYRAGVLVPETPLAMPDETPVTLLVAPRGAALKFPATPAAGPRGQHRLRLPAFTMAQLTRVARLEWLLFGLGLLVYAITRLYGLDRFPIYFFADEATHAVLAEELLMRGLRDGQGHFLPLYFEAAGMRWTPLLSVYVHLVSVALFGKAVVITRATSAVVSLLGTGAVALILKSIFRVRYWWAGALLMAIAPAWFLHSRTGFETVMMSSFFACFLLCYLLYRTRSPRYLFGALLFGAATFYTYSNGQMIMAAAGAFLLVSDFRYHIRNWRTALLGGLLLGLLMLPLLTFRAGQPESLPQHLRAIDSYWFRAWPLEQKLAQFLHTYTLGLSPQYWFIPNGQDLVRHRMQGYGNLSIVELPMLLVGLALCLWRVRSAPHRSVLLAALATPVGAALVDISITRVLAFIVPASIIAGLGLDWLLQQAGRRVSHASLAPAVFLALAAGSFGMLQDALVRGPLWYRDYGLYGMQYGAVQLFEGAIPDYLERDPNVQIMLSSTWANGADTFLRFFLPKDRHARVQMLNVDYYLERKGNLNPNVLMVMTPPEYQQAKANPKFKKVDAERIIPYPDGLPGFYFVRLAYADNVDALFTAEREARKQLVTGQVTVSGQPATVRHSQLEAGQLRDLFDGDTFTLVRGRDANPLVFELSFAQPVAIGKLLADLGSMDFTLTARLYADSAAEPKVYSQTYRNLPPDPHVELAFGGGPATVSRLRLEILQLNVGDQAKIHVRELSLR